MFIDVDDKNILEKTKKFLEKAGEKLERPKDIPRYKTVSEYEAEFKDTYKIGIATTMKAVFKQYKKLVKDNDFTALSDSGTA